MEFCLVTPCNQRRNMRLILTMLIFSILSGCLEVAGWSYHHSDQKMDWNKARVWCQSHYTDMVAIQNKGEIEHLNHLLPRISGYYWIGIRKINNSWTWVGTSKTLTKEAENWATGEPNSAGRGTEEDCVEIYIKREEDPGKWNDISCKKPKTALCYTASCKKDSCSENGECVETINNHTCKCFEGFYGEKCEHVVQCEREVVTTPQQGSFSCSHPHGNFSYGSECSYSCQPGYQLIGSETLRCTASKAWSHVPPTCEVVRCDELAKPNRGFMNCSSPLGDFSYLSLCQSTCDEGHTLTDPLSSALVCGASGRWNGTQPQCEVVQCPAITALQHGHISCDGDPTTPNSYSTQCKFTCEDGFRLSGVSAVSCAASGQWTDQPPVCEAITCPRPENPQLLSNCTDAEDTRHMGSVCSFSCSSSFNLQGEPSAQCNKIGQWSSPTPTCVEVQCPPLKDPEAGSVDCSGHFPGAVCEVSCNEGFHLQGAHRAVCTDSAEWIVDGQTPTCRVVQCPAITALQHGHISCDGDPTTPNSYSTQCKFTCEDGFRLSGVSAVSCKASGQWTDQPPVCEAVRCPQIQTASDSVMNCTGGMDGQEHTYTASCTFVCRQGYLLHGNQTMMCSRHGNWTGEVPECQAPPEPLINPTTIMMATGGATTISALSLVFWLLKKMQRKGNKFDLNSTLDQDEPPQVYKSVDSLI
ncbi:E-selectin-like isoform X2 [Sardina pilchardus]|uniref:E-selectin-like isoform X2 n=1 Tax=Sardina pilchardus TaxID=27697 RepID=UPI002E11A798